MCVSLCAILGRSKSGSHSTSLLRETVDRQSKEKPNSRQELGRPPTAENSCHSDCAERSVRTPSSGFSGRTDCAKFAGTSLQRAVYLDEVPRE